jgi:S-layer protein (TIGR01567 family)
MIGIASSQVPLSRHVNPIGNYILDSINNNILRNNSGEAETICDPANSLSETGTDRVWREGIDPSVYTWTPQTFSGFFYDPKNNVGTERLTVGLRSPGRIIDSGDLKYSTMAQATQFEFHDWGSYQVIGFMGEKYFSGYISGNVSDTNRSLINDGQLRKVLVDNDVWSALTTGSVLTLEEGYELRIKQIDFNGNKVYLSVAKDGDEVDSKVVSPERNDTKNSTYKYEVNITGERTATILAHFYNMFDLNGSDQVTVDGLFQISDNYSLVEVGDRFDSMMVTAISDQDMEMENQYPLSLNRGNVTRIIGSFGFRVGDAEVLRFAPIVQRTGTYNVRGTVIDPSLTDEFTWTPYNFEGFYYDINDDVGTETLQATISGGNKITSGDLIYTTSPQPVNFKLEDFGVYDVIGFMGDKYFAGYSNLTAFTDEANVINEGQLSKILLDSGDNHTITSGLALPLEEGYNLRIKQVDQNGNMVLLTLEKDGKEVDNKVVTASSNPKNKTSNYMYKVNLDSQNDVPIIVAHIQNILLRGNESLVTVRGIFQISDSFVSVDEGKQQGILKVEAIGSDGVTMQNIGTVSLGRGRLIDIMGKLKLDVADNARRLLTPIATRTG